MDSRVDKIKIVLKHLFFIFLISCTFEVNSPLTVTPTPIASLSCPTGYVLVPADASLGVSRFCVMKYEARAWNDADADKVIDAGEIDADGCLEAGCTTASWGSAANAPGATGDDLPWRRIHATDAKAECLSLNAIFGVTNRYDLISNREWMAIARNAESVDLNWSGGSIGNGCMFRGNIGAVNVCSYNGSDPETGGLDNKARIILNNTNEVWHLSGNVSEWVDWTTGGALDPGPTTCAAGWLELPTVACPALANDDYNTSNGTYTSAQGVGQFLGGGGGTAVRSFNFGGGGFAGIFMLGLADTAMATSNAIGFRCVFRL